MYSQHFGLTQDPFSIAPDPRYIFMSERHREALAHLLYGVTGSPDTPGGTGGGFVLLTGDIGTGKTTICRCFLEQMPSGCHVAYIFNPKLSVIELLESICEEFHIMPRPGATVFSAKDYIDALNDFLLHSHASGQNSVLIIDEAQNLAPDVLEQLRLLTNLETNERKLLQIVLIGQPELRDMLARAELEQLAQRVIARFHLDALSAPETTQYILHRLAVAGHNGTLPFDRRSLQRIHQLTQGVPRRINLLCGRALLGAWANGLSQVNRKVVSKAAIEVFGAVPKSRLKPAQMPVKWAVAAFTLIAIVLTFGWTRTLRPPAYPALPAAVAGASKPSTPIPAAVTPPASLAASATQAIAGTSIDNLETLLPELPGDINVAWRELSSTWKLPLSKDDPCQTALQQQVQCYRASKLDIPQLRQLARPGILTLQVDQKTTVYAVVTGWSDQTATLQVAGQARRVRLVALAKFWQGDFATFWQAPPDYRAGLTDGSTGAAIDWLATQLSRLDGLPVQANGNNMLNSTLRDRVRGFQSARGINADGQPGPMTFMQLESALGLQIPHSAPPATP